MVSSQLAPIEIAQPSFAGLGRRLAAYFVDLPIFASPTFLTSFTMRGLRAIGVWRYPTQPGGEEYDPIIVWNGLGAGAKLAILLGFVLSLGVIYFAVFESSPWQATFGKRLLNIYVTGDEGRRISVSRALGRWCSKFFLNFLVINLASLVTIPWTKDNKALHDMMAKTLVVRGRPVPAGSLEPWRIVSALGIPFGWLLVTFLATL